MAAQASAMSRGSQLGQLARTARRPLASAARAYPPAAAASCSSGQRTLAQDSHRLSSGAASSSSGRAARLVARAAGEAASPAAPSPKLEDLEMNGVLNVQGYINPDMPPEAQAWVVALYDEAKILQYIGFSKDLRGTLRTLFARRPDRAHSYRSLALTAMDQEAMLAVRNAWFDQNFGPPPGNKLPTERAAWQKPPEALAINERAKAQAAEELLKEYMGKIRARGCREEFTPDPAALATGKVDFLAAAALTPELLEAQRAAAEEAALATRRWRTTIDGARVPFEMQFNRTYPTNGGCMFDMSVTCQEKETFHRVIIGKPYYEAFGLDPRDAVARVFAFLLRKKVPRSTEGMILSSQFPSNYFSVSEVEQFFDDFGDEFKDLGELPGEAGFWRFARTEDYGYKGANEGAEQLRSTFELV